VENSQILEPSPGLSPDLPTSQYSNLSSGQVPVYLGSEEGDVVVIQTGGWLSSVPLLGRFWGTKKTFMKKSEIIV